MRRTPSVWHQGTGAILGLLVLLASPVPSIAQSTPAAMPPPIGLAVLGRVEHPRTLALAELQALPPVTAEVTRVTAQGEQGDSYTGAPLWALVSAAEPVDDPGGHSHLQHTILARGRDGYAVALAIGELDPAFEGKQVLVAYAQHGTPLSGLRLIVPGDAKAGRSVRDLVSIEVR